MNNLRHTPPRSAFTIIELMIVIGIIVVLIAILIPAVGYVKAQAKKSSTVALLSAIGLGLEQYRSEHNSYPPSDWTNAYPTLPNRFDRGGLMLTQGLTGYLAYQYDGAGPGNPRETATPPSPDPSLGFRTTRGGLGKIYGPYMQAGGANWKIVPLTSNLHQVVVDLWGDEILYFRAVPSNLNGQRRNLREVFQNRAATPFEGIFVIEDNQKAFKDDGTGGSVVAITNTPTNPAFLKLLGAANNNIASGELVTGRDSYLLVSAGPDREYFTADDIVATGK